MKIKFMKMLCVAGIAILSLGLTACGKTEESTPAAEETTETEAAGTETEEAAAEETTEEETTEEATEETTEDAYVATVDGLLEEVADEDAYMVMSGIAQGWAPTVMVLKNDGTFYALVDYAGQATVNFVSGEYEVKEDNSITATGALYNTGEEAVYEITEADGTYSVSVPVPDTDASADMTGTLK